MPINRDLSDSRTRFWSKAALDSSGCWLWTSTLTRGGYGMFKIGGANRSAHRVAYEFAVGPIPAGLDLDHLCRMRHCVNPDHLEPVTKRENTLRGVSPAARHARATHCAQGHPFDSSRTGGQRICRPCRRAASRRYREGLRADQP